MGQNCVSEFNLSLPEIYQVEVTSACNLKCPFCPRFQYKRKDQFLDVSLAKKISERDLGNSYFVEFQFTGEPLLHPKLSTIIDFFKGKVKVGLSTNGLLIDKQINAICKLDYVTISVDSLVDYEKVRVGGRKDKLLQNIELFLKKKPSYLVVDLQVIDLSKDFGLDFERAFSSLQEFVSKKKWDVNVRAVADCSIAVRKKQKVDCKDLCINPWFSVSVHADGDVVPCCFAFGKEYVYGNLNRSSLSEIWSSESVLQLREQHMSRQYNQMCQKCYMRSPAYFHWNLFVKTFLK